MRLWHQNLLSRLPRQQLLGQHRECCALRGKGWGRKHATVDYVFKYEPDFLVAYHILVMDEMKERGYHPDEKWYDYNYRGSSLGYELNWTNGLVEMILHDSTPIFNEHNKVYLQECIENLKQKGIEIKL